MTLSFIENNNELKSHHLSILHLCNVFFEWELEGLLPPSIEKSINLKGVFRQLQYLPFIYARQGGAVLATRVPNEPTPLPIFTLHQSPPFKRLETWGYSLLAKAWAEKVGMEYSMPPWDVVKTVNSKMYSFSKSSLPGARLLFKGDPIEKGMILKSCYGTAGRGSMLAENPKALSFCQAQWARNLPVIAEPFVRRLVDFSTQWHIFEGGVITYVGATICKTTKLGLHKSNIVRKKMPKFVEEHRAFVLDVLKEMGQMGYFGPVGFDAMVYENGLLQPIVEINARKTMGLVALTVQNQSYPDKEIEVAYVPSSNCVLPNIKISI